MSQALRGGAAVSAGGEVLVEGCTVRMSGGNLTVNGNLTVQDAEIEVEGEGGALTSIFVTGNGHLKINNSRISPEIRLVIMDSVEAEIYDSQLFSIECRNSSRARIVRSQISQILVYSNSTQYLEGLLGIMTDVDAYAINSGGSTRTEIYNCSLRSVRTWDDGSYILSVANARIGFLQTKGSTEITFDNMSIVWGWAHNGSVVWNRRAWDHIGLSLIEWGEKYAGGEINSNGAEVLIRQLEVVETPPEQLPAGLLSAGKFVNMTLYGPKWAKKEASCFINFTGYQVAGLDPSTLRIYSYTPGSGWQQLQDTGIDLVGQYVWCNISSEEEELSVFLAALGAKTSAGPDMPGLVSQYFDTGIALALAAVVLAAVAFAILLRHMRGRKG